MHKKDETHRAALTRAWNQILIYRSQVNAAKAAYVDEKEAELEKRTGLKIAITQTGEPQILADIVALVGDSKVMTLSEISRDMELVYSHAGGGEVISAAIDELEERGAIKNLNGNYLVDKMGVRYEQK